MPQLKLLILAPMPPLRGGIPLHSYYLTASLKQIVETDVWGPKKLFPTFIYPGKSQYDYSSTARIGAQDSNQTSQSWTALVLGLIKLPRGAYSHAIIPWWTSYFSLHTIIGGLLLRFRGVRPVLFCHNVLPHERSSLQNTLSRLVLRVFGFSFVQSAREQQLALSINPKLKTSILEHPAYPGNAIGDTSEPREMWFGTNGNGKIRLAMVGLLRDYKGVDLILEALVNIAPEHFEIILAGEIWGADLEQKILKAERVHPHLRVRLRYLQQSELDALIAECDALLLPYLSATGSGVLSLAKGARVPVIMSDAIMPGLDFAPGTDGIVFKSGDPRALVEAIKEFRIKKPNFDNAWTSSSAEDQWAQLAEALVHSLTDWDNKSFSDRT